MKKNFGKSVDKDFDMTRSPRNLCKSFGITMDLYGEDLTGNKIYIDDRGYKIDSNKVKSEKRIGISAGGR